MVRIKKSTRLLLAVNLIGTLLLLLGCSSNQSEKATTPDMRHADVHPQSISNGSTYTVRLVSGQVFLSLNSAPGSMIGPFVKSKQSDDEFTCEGKEGSLHRLWKDASGHWLYIWNYIQMHAEPVNAEVLQK